MSKLKKILSIFSAAAILTTSFSVQSFAQTNFAESEVTNAENLSVSDDFEMPEGLDDAEFITVDFSKDEGIIPEHNVPTLPIEIEEDEEMSLVPGCVEDTARFPEAISETNPDEFLEFEDRAESTLNGIVNAYYAPNLDENVFEQGNFSNNSIEYNIDLVYANTYTAPADQDITINKVSFYVGAGLVDDDNEDVSDEVNGHANIRCYRLGDKNLDEIDYYDYSSYYSYYFSVTEPGWYTAYTYSPIFHAGERYAVMVSLEYYDIETIMNYTVPATKGSYGTGTSYAGYLGRTLDENEEYYNTDFYLTDLAKDGMRSALNVQAVPVEEYVDYSTYLYVNESCMCDEDARFYVSGGRRVYMLKSAPSLYWGKVKGVDSYNVYREKLVNGYYVSTLVKSTTETSFVDSAVTSGYYRYRVTSVIDGVEATDYATRYVAFPTAAAPTATYKTTDEDEMIYYTVGSGFSGYDYYDVAIKYVFSDGTVTYRTGIDGELEDGVLCFPYSRRTLTLDDGTELVAEPHSFRFVLSKKYADDTLALTKPSAYIPVKYNPPAEITYEKVVAVDFTAEVKNYSVTITPNTETDYNYYNILRRESTQSQYEWIDYLYDDTDSYIDYDIIPGKKYFYAVIASNPSYSYSYYKDYVVGTKVKAATIPTVTSPVKPTIKYAQDTVADTKDSTYFTLVWAEAAGATSYSVYLAPVLENGKKGEFYRINTVYNFVKTDILYTEKYQGYYFYIVPTNSTKDINGTPAAVYFANKATVIYGDEEVEEEIPFWGSATEINGAIQLKWLKSDANDYVDEIAIGRYSGNDSMMRVIYTCTSEKNTQSYLDKTVDSNTQYKYRGLYRYYSSIYTSEDSVTAKRTATIAKPKIKAVQALTNAVSLEWNPVAGATKYMVFSYLNGAYTTQGATTATNFTATKSLANGTKYGFLVRAYVNNAWTSFTTADLVYATPVAAIGKPDILDYTTYDSAVELTWSIVDDATKYAVYTYDPETEKYSLITNSVTGNSYKVTNLKNNYVYGFLVRAYGNGIWSSYDSSDLYYAYAVSNAPDVYVYKNSSTGRVRAYWNNITNATKYTVYTYLDGKYTLHATVIGTDYEFSNLTPGVKYGFLVRAYVDGKWSSFTADDVYYYTVPAAAKPRVTVEAYDKSVELTFSGVDATKYMIFSYDKATGKYTTLATTEEKSYVAKNLKNGTEYGFLVRAYMDGAWTAFTVDDVVYVTPESYSFVDDIHVYNYYHNYRISLKSNGSGAEKYAVYTARNGKYTLEEIVNSTGYVYLKSVVPGEEVGVLVRGYVNGAWTDFTTDDITTFTAKTANISVYTASVSETRTLIRWLPVDNATRYAVYSYDYSTKKYTLLGSTSGTYYYYDNSDAASRMYFLIRPYVNGKYEAYSENDYDYVWNGDSSSHYANATGFDGGFALFNYDSDCCAEYRIYLYDEESDTYTLKAETHGETAFITGLTDGNYYDYVITSCYEGVWTEPEDGYFDSARAGSQIYADVYGGSKCIGMYFNYFDSSVCKKVAVYTYDPATNKYTLISNNINPADNDGYYQINGLKNDTEYGVLVRAYINGKWTSYTTNNIRYTTTGVYKPYYYAYRYDDTDEEVEVRIYNYEYRGYKTFYIYSYNPETAKYTLLKTVTPNSDGTIYVDVDVPLDADYQILVRASDGSTLSAFTADDCVTIY